MGKRTGAYKVLMRKPKGKGPIERPWLRWEDNIKRIFKKWYGMA
jgi:hypothetical protein